MEYSLDAKHAPGTKKLRLLNTEVRLKSNYIDAARKLKAAEHFGAALRVAK
jgi:hypothetical protein